MRRNEELTSVFLRLLGDGRLAKEVICQAATLPCSRFWITPENAVRHIKMRLDGRWGNKGNEHRMQVQKIDEIIKRCDGDYSLKKVTEVVESPAPCFYLECDSAINIVFSTLRRRRKKKR